MVTDTRHYVETFSRLCCRNPFLALPSVRLIQPNVLKVDMQDNATEGDCFGITNITTRTLRLPDAPTQ
jgi:hypothetical protein